MSRHLARRAAEQFNMRPSLVAGRYATDSGGAVGEVTSVGVIADLREFAAMDTNLTAEKVQQIERQQKQDLLMAYGYGGYNGDIDAKPFAYANGLAIIPIHGLLINRYAFSWSFLTGYNYIRVMLDAAMDDEDVLGIILDVNSQGGMVAGCRETADKISACSLRNDGKPILAVVDANCYSAAYMVSCAADHIAVTPTGGAGSIGVLLMHIDVSAMMAKVGVAVTFIFAGDHKVDGNSYEPLSKDVKADLQAEIDSIYEDFVATVAANRPNLTAEQIVATQARCLLANEALEAGLIDSVQTPSDALEAFFYGDDSNEEQDEDDTEERHLPDNDDDNEDRDNGDDPDDDDDDEDEDPHRKRQEQNNMATGTIKKGIPTGNQQQAGGGGNQQGSGTEQKVDVTAERQAAAQAERERIQGILTHAEADGRTEQANYLAYETEMSVEDAGKLMSKSAKAVPPVATPAADAGQGAGAGADGKGGKDEPSANGKPEGKNFFGAAMDSGKHPEMNAGGGGADAGTGDGKPSRSEQILAARRKAGGIRDTKTT